MLIIMHMSMMSSACLGGRSAGQPGEYVEEYMGKIGFSARGEGKIRDIVLSSKGKGWGNCKSCKIADGNHRDIIGINRKKGFPELTQIEKTLNKANETLNEATL